jgi:hypothetical protein
MLQGGRGGSGGRDAVRKRAVESSVVRRRGWAQRDAVRKGFLKELLQRGGNVGRTVERKVARRTGRFRREGRRQERVVDRSVVRRRGWVQRDAVRKGLLKELLQGRGVWGRRDAVRKGLLDGLLKGLLQGGGGTSEGTPLGKDRSTDC